jgi:hypothetical protein
VGLTARSGTHCSPKHTSAATTSEGGDGGEQVLGSGGKKKRKRTKGPSRRAKDELRRARSLVDKACRELENEEFRGCSKAGPCRAHVPGPEISSRLCTRVCLISDSGGQWVGGGGGGGEFFFLFGWHRSGTKRWSNVHRSGMKSWSNGGFAPGSHAAGTAKGV